MKDPTPYILLALAGTQLLNLWLAFGSRANKWFRSEIQEEIKEQLNLTASAVQNIQAKVEPNGGSSVLDRLARVERKLNQLDHHVKELNRER